MRKKTEVNDENDSFIKACYDNDINKGVSPNIYNGAGIKAASTYGNVEIVEVLINAGANVQTGNNAALISSSENDHLEVVKCFYTALTNAVFIGNLEVVKLLITNNKNVNDLKDMKNYSLLTNAVFIDNLEIVKYLIENKIYREEELESVLLRSASDGKIKIVKYLIENNYNKDKSNSDILNKACLDGHLDIVKYLVLIGSVLNEKHLSLSIRTNVKMIKYLIAQKLNIYYDNHTVLKYAAAVGKVEVLEVLLNEYENKKIAKSIIQLEGCENSKKWLQKQELKQLKIKMDVELPEATQNKKKMKI